MLTQDAPCSTSPSIETAPPPLVVLCGPTAAGKTIVAKELVEAARELELVPPSKGLMTALSGDQWPDLVRTWLNSEPGDDPPKRPDVDRRTDLALLRDLEIHSGARVVESAVLPMLLPAANTALVIRLTATPMVRARRIQDLVPEVTFQQACAIVDRKDFATCVAARAAWGIDIAERSAPRWRADLSVGCPHEFECPDENGCVDAVVALVRGAYAVYQCFLTGETFREWEQSMLHFKGLLSTHQLFVGRCSPLLIGSCREHTVAQWRHRLLFELDATEGLL